MRAVITTALLLGTAFATTAVADDWVRKETTAHRFSAVFPSAPKEESSVDQGVKLYSMAAGDGRALCIALRGEYPYVIKPDIELPASRDNFVKGVKATVTSEKRITFPRGSRKLTATEFTASSDTHNFLSILIIDGSSAYQVAGGVSKTNGNQADLERCVRGFTFTQ